MNIQDTAKLVHSLVSALANGKQLEFRPKAGEAWVLYGPSDGELLFDLMNFEYRIKEGLDEKLKRFLKSSMEEAYRCRLTHTLEVCTNLRLEELAKILSSHSEGGR